MTVSAERNPHMGLLDLVLWILIISLTEVTPISLTLIKSPTRGVISATYSHFYDMTNRQAPFFKISPAQMQLQEWQVKSEVQSCMLYTVWQYVQVWENSWVNLRVSLWVWHWQCKYFYP